MTETVRAERLRDAFLFVNFTENEMSYVFTAFYASRACKNLEVVLTSNSLTILGDKGVDGAKEDTHTAYMPTYEPFQNRLSVPAGVDRSKIDVKIEEGLLRITFPKTTAAKRIAMELGTLVKCVALENAAHRSTLGERQTQGVPSIVPSFLGKNTRLNPTAIRA